MADQSTPDIYAVVATLQRRIVEQEHALCELRTQLSRAQGHRPAGRRWSLLLLVSVCMLLLGAAYVPTMYAQQPVAVSEKINAPTTSGNPLLIGQGNVPSNTSNAVDTTRLYNPSTTLLASQLLSIGNYSNSDFGYFTPDAYRIAVVGTTSGVDTQTLMRVGVAGGAAWPSTLVNRASELHAPHAGSAAAVGVYGYGTGSAGYGVWGKSADSLGGLFEGKSAPIYLAPSSTNGPPTTGTHYMGELYVSADGNLYFCTAYGTPGKWVRLNIVQSFIPTVTK